MHVSFATWKYLSAAIFHRCQYAIAIRLIAARAYSFLFSIDNLSQIGRARSISYLCSAELYSIRVIDIHRINETKILQKVWDVQNIFTRCNICSSSVNIPLFCAVGISMSYVYLPERIYAWLRHRYGTCNIPVENAEGGMLITTSCASLSVWMAPIYASRLWDEQLLDLYTARRLLGKKIHYMYHRAPLFLFRPPFHPSLSPNTPRTSWIHRRQYIHTNIIS